MSKGYKIEIVFLNLAIITSILSFSSVSGLASICELLMYLFWFLALGTKFIYNKINLNPTIKYMVFTYIFFFIIFKLFHYLGFYPSGGSGQAGYLGYCAIFYIMGYNFTWKDKKALTSIFASCFIGLFTLLCTSIPMVNQLEDERYFGKNQLGQFLGSTIIFSVFILPRLFKKKWIKFLFYSCGALALVVLMKLHSRTPLIALIVTTIVSFVLKEKKTQKDYKIALGVIAVLFLLIYYLGGIQFIKDLFEIDSETNISSAEGLNQVTSGRMDWVVLSINDFLSSPIIGIGAYAYVDNFMCCTLRTGGILLACFIWPFVYGKLYINFRNANKYLKIKDNKDISIELIMVVVRAGTIYFFTISFMEGYPPLGPGTSVFILWLMIGISENILEKNGILELSLRGR